MQKDSLLIRILKILLAVLVTVLAVSALAAVTALLLYGLVLAAVALALLFLLSPEDLKAFIKAAVERIDGWIGRLEGLWGNVKEGLDAWGAREMARRDEGDNKRPSAQTGNGDGPPAGGELSEKA